MEFKIPVDEAQSIMNKLNSVAKVGSDEIDGMVFIDVDDTVNFCVHNSSVSLVVSSRKSDIINKGKVLCRLSDFRGYLTKFTKLTDEFGTDVFHFVLDSDSLLIKTKTIFRDSKPSYKKLVVPILDNKIYPKIKFVEDSNLIVNSSILKEGLASVLHCVNPKEVRTSLKGVAITISKDKLIFAATNGVKLSEAVLDINAVSMDESTHIFRFDFASTLRYILDKDSQVFIKFEGSNVYVKCNDLYIIGSTIINEEFPDYRKAFESYLYCVTLPRLSFYDSVENAVDVLDIDDNSRLSIKLEGNKLVLKNDRIDIEQEFDDPFEYELEIDVNGRFLSDLLYNFGGDTVHLCFKDSDNPVVLKSGVGDGRTVLLTHLRRR